MTDTNRFLVIGALGQIGSELVPALRARYGADNVIASDVREPSGAREAGPFVPIDVTNRAQLNAAVEGNRIGVIINMAALLSATGENNPQLCWEINIGGLLNTLEVARTCGVKQVFVPSSIAAFGPTTPRDNTPQDTVLQPTTMYGVTKVSGELLCDYYFRRYGVDARGLRYPGIISHATLPGGGTTDYAVEIFYAALTRERYTCFLREDTRLPMMYMPDCIKSTLDLMAAPSEPLTRRALYNVTAMSFTPAELAVEIQKHLPQFRIDYAPDVRQNYADSWPMSIDDSVARRDWGWQPDYDLARMTADMLENLRGKLERGEVSWEG
jgi:nucleoside-diphosphate-sugar epimerase